MFLNSLLVTVVLSFCERSVVSAENIMMRQLVLFILLHVALISAHEIEVGTKAFSPNEFLASYQLMVQYKHGPAPTCPLLITYNSHPVADGTDLLIRHNDMRFGSSEETLQNCTDGGTQRLVLSRDLVGPRLQSYIDDFDGNLDKTTVFDSLQEDIGGGKYFISVSDSARVCGETWFHRGENFFYFDEGRTVTVRIVAKIVGSVPKFLELPLIRNIRYMVVAGTGSTCVYRVQSDVESVIRGTPRPSDSPSVTVRFEDDVFIRIV